ncbi:MAG: S8 family serine peptidase [Bacteroidia bacterium]|nr:S8 family serine peptidase [Bacteroidia bacterium]
MKVRYILSFLLLFAAILNAQEVPDEDRYYFYVTIKNAENLVFSKNEDGTLSLSAPTSIEEAAIYNSYKIYEFERAFPGSRRSLLQEVYRVVTNRVELIGSLWRTFPEKYTKVDQFYPNETAFYPNDYGTTSPKKNLGKNLPLYDLDLINAAEAWGITRGSEKVVVGISDARVDSTNAEFKGRVTYLKYSNSTRGQQCAHGSNVAAISIARADNAYGRPGICSNCSVISNGYGSFKYIEELVAAGARVINASWATCKMGKFHKEIEKRINELYEDGIIIVAGAGNAKNCNGDDDFPPDDYAYPASFEKVISVTGVFSRFDSHLDSTFMDKDGYKSAQRLKDRHAKVHAIVNSGKVIPKYVKYAMQYNKSIDICAPAQSYLLGNELCDNEAVFGGATSSTAPYITGVIGLMWSVNYCLDAYETESILKLTSAAIDHLPGNERFKGQLGSGRVDAYKAVKMARDMKELMGNVNVSGRDFSRFHFRLKNSPYNITVENQTFRDSSSVAFTARHGIVLKPGTRLAPDKNGYVSLGIDPAIPIGECEPKPPKKYESLYEEQTNRPVNTGNLYNFGVNYSSKNKQLAIRVKAASLLRMKGVYYTVKVFSPDKRLLKEKRFTLPEDGSMNIDVNSYEFSDVLITCGTRKENHRINTRAKGN